MDLSRLSILITLVTRSSRGDSLLHVDLERVLLREGLQADDAGVGPLTRVDPHMLKTKPRLVTKSKPLN